MTMQKTLLSIAAILGALAVALGAFAAHGLKELLAADQLQIFETAVRYQFYHVFAILAAGILYKEFSSGVMLWAGRLFTGGIIFFSGSLYLLCYSKYKGLGLDWLGAITPVGGLLFIAGWLLLFMAIVKKK